MDYQRAYTILFNAITDAIYVLVKSKIVTSDVDNGITILKEAQFKTEDMYIAGK